MNKVRYPRQTYEMTWLNFQSFGNRLYQKFSDIDFDLRVLYRRKLSLVLSGHEPIERSWS